MDGLKQLYKQLTGKDATLCEPIKGSGSNRQYFRLRNDEGRRLIGVVGTSKEENHAFIYLSNHFAAQQIPVPEVLIASKDELRYIQTDLGNTSLFDALETGRKAGGEYSKKEKELLCRTIALLPDIQIRGAKDLDFSQCYPQAEMDRTNVLFDLNYFKYCFLKATGVDFHEMRLEENFQQMATDLTSDKDQTFLYRDFQARNIMLDKDGCPWFIDFQGGRKGAVQYDVASFLWQASAKYPDSLKEELIRVYLSSLQKYTEVDEALFRKRLALFVLFRQLQVLGAYGFRGYFERKSHFLQSIPPAIDNLNSLLIADGCPYPYLRQILVNVVKYFKNKNEKRIFSQDALLTVRVFSFSYKRGIPEDKSGNGGGYVFDCRSTHNPGRYEAYKQMTGLDEPVIRFLEEDGEILTFLESVYRLAKAHVERYLERGFTNLMFSFGCTGGQHRSVYCAQHLAEYLHKKYGIKVELCHREQNIHQTFV